MPIDHHSATPLKTQLISDLLTRLASGEFEIGQKFPSLRTLAAEYKVAEMTIAPAVQELQREGFLVATPGKGNFVRSLPVPSVQITRTRGSRDLRQVDAAVEAVKVVLLEAVNSINARLDALDHKTTAELTPEEFERIANVLIAVIPSEFTIEQGQ